MPLKWKIFRIINYFHIATATGAFIFLLQNYLNVVVHDTSDLLIFILIDLLVLLPSVNGSINIYFVEKIYPNNYISKRLERIAKVFLILSIIAQVLIVLALIIGIFQATSPENKDNPLAYKGFLLLSAFFIIISTGVYIVWLQILLRKTIRRNFENALDNFLKN